MEHILEFKKALQVFLRGKSSTMHLQHALDECLATRNCRIDLVRKLLDNAKAAGMDPGLEQRLRNRIDQPSGEDGTAMPESTGRGDVTVAAGNDVTAYTLPPEDTGDSDKKSDAPPSGGTGASWPTSVDQRGESKRSIEVKPGLVLKDRFELLEALGEGGMGVVYKAVDRLKVEARDRNPYLAIKLLTVDFQSHPEAFISLQRESAKAQRLAHPNIATVYDFDRDRGTIYMTMELLTGHALNHFIRRKIPVGGLTEAEAMPMIRQLAAGLSYAHQANLVHSDLKPGNCWLGDDGSMKLLDFGIARASKTTLDESGETTVFDPGQLGALTPAYATVEMFDAEAPDPRDDIYALACISYELLTGKHPFNKVPAPKAMARGLTPPNIDKLTKRQNQGLARALAFKREDRTPTVDEFVDEISFRKNNTPRLIASGLVLLLVLGAFAYQPVSTYFQDRRNQEITQSILAGDYGVAEARMPEVLKLEDRSRKLVMDRVKEHLIGLYEQRAGQAIDASQGRYDFNTALAEIQNVKRYYPDSATILGIESNLENRRNRLLNELDAQFNEYLDQGRLIAVPGQQDITDVLATIAQVDPQHPLLNDPRLPVRYAEEANLAIQAGQLDKAEQILSTGLQISPDDSGLASLRFEVKREIKQRQDNQLAISIEQRLQPLQATIQSMEDFLAVRDDLVTLSQLKPDNKLVANMKQRLQGVFNEGFGNSLEEGLWARAEKQLFTFARLLDLESLQKYRRVLSEREQQAGFDTKSAGDRQPQIESLQADFDGLMRDLRFDPGWETDLLLVYKELTAVLEPGDEWLDRAQKQISIVYIDRATSLGNENRYAESLALLERGKHLASSASLERHMETVREAEQRFKARQAEKARLARIEGMQQTLLTQAKADRVSEAQGTLASLRKALPATDSFLLEKAPTALADAYQRLALAEAEQKRYDSAMRLVQAGLALAPEHQALLESKQKYEDEARLIHIRNQVRQAPPLNVDSLSGELVRIRARFPERAAALQKEIAGQLAVKIRRLEKRDVAAAIKLRDQALRLLPGNLALSGIQLKLPPKPSRLAARGREYLESGKLTAAQGILQEALRKEADHPEVLALQSAIRQKKKRAENAFAQGQAALRQKQREKARTALQQALSLWSDNQEFHDSLKQMSASSGTRTTATGARPCNLAIAGYGSRARGTCYDSLGNRKKGPVMVVVPADTTYPKGFAIGKYEVSVADYNLYCAESGACQPVAGDTDLPITNLSLAQAKAYADWLSARTRHNYRLPTEAEWVYAATAGSAPTKKDFNCRVSRGGQILKGHALISVRTGKANAWGLTNFVGNAQEWVVDGARIQARGGAFTDSLAKCDVTMAKSHPGSADNITGFRLFRVTD